MDGTAGPQHAVPAADLPPLVTTAVDDAASVLAGVRARQAAAASRRRLEVRAAALGWRFEVHEGALPPAVVADGLASGWRPTRRGARRAGMRALRARRATDGQPGA